jgi:hypothetical protein
VQKYREDYSTIFWVEAGQKESIERDYLQIYQLLFDPTSVTRPDAVGVEDAVAAVKRWFRGRTERSLVVFDGADALDDGSDESYLNLEFSYRTRYEHGSAQDRDRIRETGADDHAGGIIYRGDATFEFGHPLVYARVSRKKETAIGHESNEVDSSIW